MKRFDQFTNEGEGVDEAASMMKVIGAKTLHRKKYKKAIDFIKKKLKSVENIGATKVFRVSKIVDKYSLPIDAKVAYELIQNESANVKLAREKIKSEKQADKAKHDRMMDQARRRDTRTKNAMTESEIHVRLDHLDGDSRQKKANDVMKKHEKAGHIKYGGSTDKGVIFKAKSKSHADRLHKDLKPHATGVEFYEEKSAQDPDIKDREGTQPAAYHKGLKKTTKAKRDAHFKKHGPKSDDNPSAYKDAPGDKEAREKPMKKSKFTKFVDDMMDEKTCWKAYRQQGMKKKGDKQVPNCVPESLEQAKKPEVKKEVGKKSSSGKWTKADHDYLQKNRQKQEPEWQGEEVEQTDEARQYKVPSNYAAMMAKKRKKAGTSEFGSHPDKKKDVKKEEVEQVDELTKKTIQRYQDQSALHHRDAKLAGATEIQKRREKGYDLSDKKLSGKAKVKATGKLSDYPYRKEEAQFEEMSPESQKAHRNMFKAAQKKKDDSTAQAEREKRLKAKGWVKNDRGGMSKVSEAMGDAAHKAAVKHITDLGKKNKMTVGQQRMHIDDFPQKHDAKTRAAAKTINKNQYGGWKVGKDGKTTQSEEVIQ
jgi:hypothetical protein